jgi:hypothetical protein
VPLDAHVRVSAPSLGITRSIALVDSVTADTLYVRSLSVLNQLPRVAIPMGAITRLDLSVPQRDRRGRMVRGAAWGAVALVVIAPTAYLLSGPDDDPDSWGWASVAFGVIVGMPFAAAAGGIVGLLLPNERWRRVLPKRR